MLPVRRAHTHTSYMEATSPSSPRRLPFPTAPGPEPEDEGADPRQVDLEQAIAAAKAAPRPDPPSPPEPAPKRARRPRILREGLPAADDLEGWRRKLREAKGTTGRRCVVGAWLELWGGGLDGYGNPVLPDGPPAGAVADALRSAAEHYWRRT